MGGNPKGARRNTRNLFSKKYGTNGQEHLSTYLHVFKRGDYVTVMANPAFPQGMPHKAYHGKIGRIFNITAHGLGVEVNKRVHGRVIAKRINIRTEHVRPSGCRKDFLKRKEYNEAARRQYKITGKWQGLLKRQPKAPREAHIVSTKNNTPQDVMVIPYEFVA